MSKNKTDYRKILSITLICMFPFFASAMDDEGEYRIPSKRSIARQEIILKQIEISSKQEELKKIEIAYKALRKEKKDIIRRLKQEFECERIKYNKWLFSEKEDRRLGRGPEGE